MTVNKKAKSYNDYVLSCSFGELIAIERALADNHLGPVADELYQGLVYYLEGERLLRPGQDEEEEEEDDGMGGSIEGLDDPDAPSAHEEEESLGAGGDEHESPGEAHPADAYLEAPPANDTDSTGQGRADFGEEGSDLDLTEQ